MNDTHWKNANYSLGSGRTLRAQRSQCVVGAVEGQGEEEGVCGRERAEVGWWDGGTEEEK